MITEIETTFTATARIKVECTPTGAGEIDIHSATLPEIYLHIAGKAFRVPLNHLQVVKEFGAALVECVRLDHMEAVENDGLMGG